MCGRFTLTATPEALDSLFPSLFDGLELEPRYNVAPSQNVLAVRQSSESGQAEAVLLRWGLVPSWADDMKIGYSLINARSETAATKPAFRSAWKARHCLILADGFFEWQKLTAKTKQPFHLRMTDFRPFAFAGLWERWTHEDKTVESCTILTTEANATTRPVHDRMPVIVPEEHYHHWLDPKSGYTTTAPFPAERMTAIPVSTVVNNPRHDVPECIEGVEAG